MKIFIIIQCSNLGGMEKVTLDSVSLLISKGHSVTMYSMQPVGDLAALASSRGLPLLGPTRYRFAGLTCIPSLSSLLRSEDPDRVWIVGHSIAAMVAATIARRPCFLSIHYHHSERPLAFWALVYGIAQVSVTRIHFVSRYIMGEVSSLFWDKGKAVSFPNALSAPSEPMNRSQARSQLGLGDHQFVIGNAGWLIPRKAFDVFIRTAALVKARAPEAHFLIAGDGDERTRLEALVSELGLDDCVTFLGWTVDLEPFYGALDILLFNSRFDCLPTTPLEAMVRGIPVVCSLENGGLKEVIRHPQDGFLIDRHDPEALADAVLRLRGDNAFRAEVANSGRLRVNRCCSPGGHVERLIDFLDLESMP